MITLSLLVLSSPAVTRRALGASALRPLLRQVLFSSLGGDFLEARVRGIEKKFGWKELLLPARTQILEQVRAPLTATVKRGEGPLERRGLLWRRQRRRRCDRFILSPPENTHKTSPRVPFLFYFFRHFEVPIRGSRINHSSPVAAENCRHWHDDACVPRWLGAHNPSRPFSALIGVCPFTPPPPRMHASFVSYARALLLLLFHPTPTHPSAFLFFSSLCVCVSLSRVCVLCFLVYANALLSCCLLLAGGGRGTTYSKTGSRPGAQARRDRLRQA